MGSLTRFSLQPAMLLVLLVAVVVSALGAVYVRHESRERFIELQQLLAERDRLRIEWGQLQLEQSTLATHGRVEDLVRRELDMLAPRPDEIRIIFGD